MNALRAKAPLPCPFCGNDLERSADGTQWRHPGSLMLSEGCILRGRRLGEDELAQWNQRTAHEEAVA